MTGVTYKRIKGGAPAYQVFLEGKLIAIAQVTRSRQWIATTIARPQISVPACQSRHEAVTALLGRLVELEKL